MLVKPRIRTTALLMPLLLARMVITLVFFSSSSSFLYVYSWDRLSSSFSCSFSRRHLCFRNVSLFLPFSLLVSLLLLGRYKFEWFFIFYFYFFSLRLASLPTWSRHISSKEEYVVSRFGYIGVKSGMHGVTLSRSGRNANVVLIIGSASKRMPKAANFVSIFVLVFFLTSFFFFFVFFHILRVFLDQLLFFYLVNPRSLPLETIPFRSKKRERIG